MSSGHDAFGTFLIWNYQKLLELSNISGPSQTADDIDMTSHNSADGFKEFIAGLRDAGEISIEGNFVPSNTKGQIAFHTDMQAGTARTCWISMPMATASSVTFSAYAKGFDSSFPVNDKIGVSGGLKISGKPTMYTSLSTGLSALSGIEENTGAALSINETPAAGTYAYTCTVNTASDWVKLTVTAATHTVYIDGVAEATGVQSAEIALGAAGTTTDILIIVYQANKSPRLYTLTVTRPAA